MEPANNTLVQLGDSLVELVPPLRPLWSSVPRCLQLGQLFLGLTVEIKVFTGSDWI